MRLMVVKQHKDHECIMWRLHTQGYALLAAI
jgi:hypothetical protein